MEFLSNIITFLSKFVILLKEYYICTIDFFNKNYSFFNTREWAIIVWATLFIVFFIITNKKVKNTLFDLLKIFLNHKILITTLFTFLFIVIVVNLLYLVGLWSPLQLKNTILWGIFTGFFVNMKVATNKTDVLFYKDWILNSFTLAAIVQFVVGIETFNFKVELFLIVPLSFMISIFLGVSKSKTEYKLAENFFNILFILFGVIILFFSIKNIINNINKINKVITLLDFVLPFFLSLLFLPYIFFLKMLCVYEVMFIRIKIKKEDSFKAKLYLLQKINFRYHLLEKWFQFYISQKSTEFKDIEESISLFFKHLKLEKKHPHIEIYDGWSPFEAKYFLQKYDLSIDVYHPLFDDEWYGCSKSKKIETGVLTNSVFYSISGTEEKVLILKLVLDVFNSESEKMALSTFKELVEILYLVAFKKEIPQEILDRIDFTKDISMNIDVYNIEIVKNIWLNKKSYDYSFSISHK